MLDSHSLCVLCSSLTEGLHHSVLALGQRSQCSPAIHLFPSPHLKLHLLPPSHKQGQSSPQLGRSCCRAAREEQKERAYLECEGSCRRRSLNEGVSRDLSGEPVATRQVPL